MNSGASWSLSKVLLRTPHRSGVISSGLRKALRGILVSAERIRCASSIEFISRENIIVVSPWRRAADLAKSTPSVDLPIAGRPATTIICPG